MATIILTVTAEDFDRLTYLSAEWHPDILKHPNRFDGAPAPLGFNKIYWCESYVETMLCQHYLGLVGEESVTKRDFTLGTWSIFTNYDVDKWVN